MKGSERKEEIAVVLPVYNGAKYLKESIQSVLGQGFYNFRLHILNDCSTDNSEEIVAGFLADSRVVYHKNPTNKGLFPTLNALIEQSNAPLIHLWAQDDIMEARCLEKIVAFHRKYPEISFSYCDVNIIDENGRLVEKSFKDYTPELIPSSLHDKIAFYTGSITGNICNVTIKRKVLEEVGLFDEGMKMSGDFEMWVRLTEKYPIGRIPIPLINLRNHSEQLSRQLRKKYFSTLEDLTIYDTLTKRASTDLKAWGEIYFIQSKLCYYYSLALQLIRSGQFKYGLHLLWVLNKRKNVATLSYFLIKNKFKGRSAVTDNSFLFDTKE